MSSLPRDSKEWSGKQRVSGGALLTLALGIASIAVVVLAASGSRWTPPVAPMDHIYALAACGATVVVGLAVSRFSPSMKDRSVCGVAIALALGASWLPIDSYFGTYHDYPWIVLGTAVAVLIVGGVMSGQGWLGVVVPAFLGVWFYGGAILPDSAVPKTSRAGDLQCTLVSVNAERSVCEFWLQGPPGMNLAKTCNLDDIRLSGHVGLLIPVSCKIANRWPPADQPDVKAPANQVAFMSWAFPPVWSRSWDYKIIVPMWPKSPTLKLLVPITSNRSKQAQPTASKSAGGLRLSASNAHMAADGSGRGYMRLTLVCTGLGQRGLHVVDDHGRTVRIEIAGASEEKAGTKMDCRLWPARGVKTIRIDAFTDSQLTQAERVFEFHRVPTMLAPKTPDLKVERPDWLIDEAPKGST